MSIHDGCYGESYPPFPIVKGIKKEEAIEIFRTFYSRGNPNGLCIFSLLFFCF